MLSREKVVSVLSALTFLAGFLLILAVLAPYFTIRATTSTNNNHWVHNNDSDTVIVFVHGIFSDTKGCWTNKDKKHYFPEMVMKDADFGDPSIFVAGYATTLKAGKYGVASSAADVWKALSTPVDGRVPAVTKRNIIFVCHSTGGIVVRYLLLDKKAQMRDKNIGLVLIASPSAGSEFARLLSPLSRLYDSQLASELRDQNNALLEDLDDRFRDLVYHRDLRIAGVEAFEQNGLLRRVLGRAVPKESASRYFGHAVQLAGQNHITSVKPADSHHPAYSLLLNFCTQDFRQLVESAAHEAPAFETAQRRWQTDSSDVAHVAISADGDEIAYVRVQAGLSSLMLSRVNHTDGATVVVQPKPNDYSAYEGVAFDAEGEWIYYVRAREGNSQVSDLWRVRRNGHNNVRILKDVDTAIKFNPGKPGQFAYVHGDPAHGRSEIVAAMLQGKAPSAIPEPTPLLTRSLPQYIAGVSWAPSGNALLVISGELHSDEMMLSILDDRHMERRIASRRRWRSIDSAVWLRSGEILFAGTETNGGPRRIWLTRPTGGEATDVTRDLGSYGSLGVTADGKRLVAIQEILESKIRMGYATGPGGEELSTTRSRLDGFDGVAAMASGAIIFTRRSGPDQDLIYFDPATRETRELVAGAGVNESPAICGPGFAVFARADKGAKNIWKVTLDASPVTTRLTGGTWDAHPACSPDGKRIAYSVIDAQTSKRSLWLLENQSPKLLAPIDARRTTFSPDGKKIAAVYADEKEDYRWRVGIIDPATGKVEAYDGFNIVSTSAPRLRWLSNDQITFAPQNPVPLLRSLHTGTNAPSSPILIPKVTRVFDFDWIERGSTFVYAGGSPERDVITLTEPD